MLVKYYEIINTELTLTTDRPYCSLAQTSAADCTAAPAQHTLLHTSPVLRQVSLIKQVLLQF